jgi:hypothetical protein
LFVPPIQYNEKCDVYSFGVVFYEIVMEEEPWEGKTIEEILRTRRNEKKELQLPTGPPPTVSNLFHCCTHINPDVRYSADDIIEHLESMRPELLDDASGGEFMIKLERSRRDVTISSTQESLSSDIIVNHDEIVDLFRDGQTPGEMLERAIELHRKGNYAEAYELFLRIVDDKPHAAFRVGEYLCSGRGVEKDVGKGLSYLKRAIEDGDADAMDQLGMMHYKGNHVERDVWKASQLFNEAANKKHPHGLYHLGICYSKGIGVDRADLDKAKDFFIEAARRGSKEARKICNDKDWVWR